MIPSKNLLVGAPAFTRSEGWVEIFAICSRSHFHDLPCIRSFATRGLHKEDAFLGFRPLFRIAATAPDVDATHVARDVTLITSSRAGARPAPQKAPPPRGRVRKRLKKEKPIHAVTGPVPVRARQPSPHIGDVRVIPAS